MAPISRKLLREINEMQGHSGRLLRNMSFASMVKRQVETWQPLVDVYESGEEIILYCDLAGVMTESLELVVEEQQVCIRGRRLLPRPPSIVCVHQLEIETGAFERTVALPVLVDVDQVSSTFDDGILVVLLRKRIERRIVVRIQVQE